MVKLFLLKKMLSLRGSTVVTTDKTNLVNERISLLTVITSAFNSAE